MHKNAKGVCISCASFTSRISERILHILLIVTTVSFNQEFCVLANTAHNTGDMPWDWCRLIRFLDPTLNDVVAIASYPGSGVTWLRYLLQQTTGVATGSLYPDNYFLTHGFPGDDRHDRSVLAVNTHEYPVHRKYSKVILLIRDPMEAILYNFKGQSAEFVTPEGINMTDLIKDAGWWSHINFIEIDSAVFEKINKNIAKLELLRLKSVVFNVFSVVNCHNADWNFGFVELQTRKWKDYYLTWLSDTESPLHVVFYDGLKKKPKEQLTNILHFIGFTDYRDVDLACAVERKDDFWIKNGMSKYPLDPYSKWMKAAIDEAKTTVYQEVRRRFMVTLVDRDLRRNTNLKNCKTWRVVRNDTVECLQDIGRRVGDLALYSERKQNEN